MEKKSNGSGVVSAPEANVHVAETVAALVANHVKPVPLPLDLDEKNGNVIALPAELKAVDLSAYVNALRDKPKRRVGKAVMTQLDSFIAHVNRFKDKDSALFADNDMEKPSITAVLNYHISGADSEPRFGDHRTEYKFPLSEEWKVWQQNNGKQMGQKDFAEFIEDRIGDIMSPGFENDSVINERVREFGRLLGGEWASPSALQAVSRGLSVREGQRFKQATNLSTGEISMVFETTHTDDVGGPLKVPNMFLLAIPVFVAGIVYQVAVRLRYRVQGGQVLWFYELYRDDKVFEDAFEMACHEARDKTALPLFIGAPE